LFRGDRNIPALTAKFATEMLPADTANSATGGALHGGDECAGVVHGICLLFFGAKVRLPAEG